MRVFKAMFVLIFVLFLLIGLAFVVNAADSKSEVGFVIHLQPYLEAPAKEAVLDAVAFNNEPSNIPVIWKDIKLYVADSPIPFTTIKVNKILKTFHATGLKTRQIEETLFPGPMSKSKMPYNQEELYYNYGHLLTVKTININLVNVLPQLKGNQTIQIRAEATFINGGKPEILTSSSESTYMEPLTIPQPSNQFSITADSYNGWYRTDGHVHTDWSDGSGTIEQVAAAGKNAGLATIIITDHGDCFDPDSNKFKGTWSQQTDYINNHIFDIPVLNGEEVSENPGTLFTSHYLAYGINHWVYNDIDYVYPDEQYLVNTVNNNNFPYSIGGPAHPDSEFYPWHGMEEEGMAFIEVFEALGDLDDEALDMWDEWNAAHLYDIMNGSVKFLVAVANSDAHNPSDVGKFSTYFYSPQGVNSGWDYLNSLRDGNVVASETPSFGYFELNNNPMGSVIDIHSGEDLTFIFTHVPGGYVYNYVNKILIIKNDSSNNPIHITLAPDDENATSSMYTIKPGDSLYPTSDGYYRVSIEFRHKNSWLAFSTYTWTICQPIFFDFH